MRILVLTVCVLMGLSACTPKLVDKLPYYKLDIVQGIPLDAPAVLSIKEGMSRQQVVMEIGTPLLRPSFRADRWDYVYEIVHGGKVKANRTLSIFFEQDVVKKIEGDALDYAREHIKEQNIKNATQ